MAQEGTVVIALAGMAFVMLGVFQFLRNFITSSQKDYNDVRKKYEDETKKNQIAQNEILIWKHRAYHLKRVNLELRNDLDKCQKAFIKVKSGDKTQ